MLIKKHLTVSTMESATSGQIASLITDTEGSSAVLKGAFITYCNEAKIMQGLFQHILFIL
jgi:nicotinamide mononucleotide (NMN) deamidase PncC